MPANMNHYDAAIRICVDQVTDGRICGRAVSRRLLRPFSFSDIGGLLLQLEEVLDAQNFPQAFERTRTFCPERGEGSAALAAKDLNSGMSREEVEAARGERATVQLLCHHPAEYHLAGLSGLAGRDAAAGVCQRTGTHQVCG